jgi:hypothetical protein
MSKRILTWTVIWLIGFFLLLNVSIPHAVETVTLRDGTLVILKVLETIGPEGLGPGDIIKLEVAEDVKVNKKVVIKRGTPAVAEVITAEKRGMMGKAGKIAISLRSTMAVDGQKIPLRGTLRREGAERVGASVAVSALVCPLALLLKGEGAEIPAGSEVKGYVDNTMNIKVR